MPSLVEIGLVVLEKKLKMWKVYDKDNDDDYNDNVNDDGQIFIRKAHLSLWLRWAKKVIPGQKGKGLVNDALRTAAKHGIQVTSRVAVDRLDEKGTLVQGA